jgi:nitrogen-specific signal transduction histidine kinase
MNLGHIRAHAFEAGDVELLCLVSAPITLGLERMHYHSEADRLHAEVEQAGQHCSRLEEELAQLRSAVPTAQLLESLNQRIKIPLSDIAENAQFLLDSFAPRQEEKTSRSGRRSKVEIKRGLREIRNEANQITRATERLLKRSLV